MSSGVVGSVGRHVPAFSSTLRPNPLDELRAWGAESLVRGRRVLDLGCGDGRFAFALARLASNVEGLDPDAEAIAGAEHTARETGVRNVHFAVGAAQHLPYPDSALDVVVLSWTL